MPSDATVIARLRLLVPWLGVALLAGIASLAAAHVLRDAWRVAAHVDTLASLRVVLTAGAVMGAAVAWVLVIAWLASGSRARTRLAVLAGFATLVGVRLAVALAYDGVLSGEPGVYHHQAVRLVAGDCCLWDEPVDRPIGYILLLAGTYAALGQSAVTAEALNVVFALLTGLFVYRLSAAVYGERIGAVALLLYALWPAGALMVPVRMPDLAYSMAFAGVAWASTATAPGWHGSAFSGAVLGLSQYLRPTSMLLLPVVLLARAWEDAGWRQAVRRSVVPATLGFLVVLLPVVAWNLTTRGALDLSTSAFGGSSMYHGTNEASGGTWSRAAAETLGELAGEDTWARSREGQRLAIERILRDPLGFAVLAVRKQDTLWGTERYGVRYGVERRLASRPYLPRSVLPSLASGAFYTAVTALAAVGLYLRRRRPDALMELLVVTLLAVSLVHALVEVRDRYHSYVTPLFMPYAAIAIGHLAGRLSRRIRRRPDAGPDLLDPSVAPPDASGSGREPS